MKTNPLLKNESLAIETYTNLMSDIECMQPYIGDPDIFNSESEKLTNFLIHSFCCLHTDFHYLSFLNSEDVDIEIIKVAGILQILSTSDTHKRYKLFDNMTKDEIHKFWLKFFGLFKNQNNCITDSLFNISCEIKINFFKDMGSTLNYLNYQFPIISGNKFNDFNVTNELDNWKQLKSESKITPDESLGHNFVENPAIKVNIDNLITDLQQLIIMCNNNNSKLVCQKKKPEHLEFFTTFIEFSKNILQFKSNVIVINSKFLEEHNSKLLTDNENILKNLYFFKKCNNIMKTLKSEIKTL